MRALLDHSRLSPDGWRVWTAKPRDFSRFHLAEFECRITARITHSVACPVVCILEGTQVCTLRARFFPTGWLKDPNVTFSN